MTNGTTTLSLDDRIAAAFTDGQRSDEVAALIDEAEAAAASAREEAEQARARALDPALSAREVAEARRQMGDATFARDRLSAAVPRQQKRRKELLAAEEDARRWVAYEQAKAEPDRLAEELARVYPPIAEQLAELVARIDANDKHAVGPFPTRRALALNGSEGGHVAKQRPNSAERGSRSWLGPVLN
jgi:hypothetical protein